MVSERWVLHPTRIPQKPPMGVTMLTNMLSLGKPLASSGTPAQARGSKMLDSLLLLPAKGPDYSTGGVLYVLYSNGLYSKVASPAINLKIGRSIL